MALTDMKLRTMKPRDKQYKMSDGEGLYILVKPTGSKLWQMAYRFDGKTKTLSFGPYPRVSLLQARRAREEAKRSLADGVDPGVKKSARKTRDARGRSPESEFEAVAERWFEHNQENWVSGYGQRIKSRLEKDVYPEIGHIPISEVEPIDVLTAIRKIEERGAIEMARRVFQSIRSVFKFAVSEGTIKSDPTRDIDNALAPKKKTKKRSAIKAKELPVLMTKIENYQGDVVTILALKLIIHTLVRTNELRNARWDEFENMETNAPNWRIPAERMKLPSPHIVPLSKQSVAIIKEAYQISGHQEWVFPSPVSTKRQPISENTMLYGLYKLGYHSKATVHGFRSTASTVLNEQEFNRDWVELQLAHVDSSIRGVYNEALYLRQRRGMMQWWSDFVDTPQRPPEDELFGDLV